MATSWTGARSPVSRIDQAVFVLQIVTTLADAVTFIPGLKMAAELAQNVANIAKTVKTNKEECINVADQAIQLVLDMIETTRGLTGANLDPSLMADVIRFKGDLETIQDILTEQATRSRFTRVLNHLGDTDNINKCKEMIDSSVRRFEVKSILILRLQMTRLVAKGLDAPASHISTGQTKARARLLIMSMNDPHPSFNMLSQHPVIYNCKRYPTGFHLYQSLKFLDAVIAERVRRCSEDPIKALEVAEMHNQAVRQDWTQVRVEMADEVLWSKFVQYPTLLQELLAADAEIINNTEHPFWGLGPKGNGPNEWGKALERLRDKFRGYALDITKAATPAARILIFHLPDPHPSFNILSAHPVIYNDKRYPTAFHLYQSLKFSSVLPEVAERIRVCSENTDVADQIQQQFSGAVAADWDRLWAWDQAQWYKFSQHPNLLQALLATGSAKLIYNRNHEFWGIGSTNNGRNQAGKALERLRRAGDLSTSQCSVYFYILTRAEWPASLLPESTMTTVSNFFVAIDDLPQCEVFEARKEHKATVFFLHGLGDTAKNLGYVISHVWKHPSLDNVKLVMPTAPTAPLQINHGRIMSTWFDVYEADHVNRREDEDGLRRSASMLNGLIQEEHDKHGIPYARIIIGGISQGGAVSLLTALTTSHPIGGVYVLSSYITLRKKIPEIRSSISKDLSIFWGHGNADRQVDHDAWKGLAEHLAGEIKIPFRYYDDDGKRLEAEQLRESGTNALLFHTYNDLGHWFSSDEMDDLIVWISFVVEE